MYMDVATLEVVGGDSNPTAVIVVCEARGKFSTKEAGCRRHSPQIHFLAKSCDKPLKPTSALLMEEAALYSGIQASCFTAL